MIVMSYPFSTVAQKCHGNCSFTQGNLTAVNKLKLPWVNWNCRDQIVIAVSKLKLSWANWNCREQIEIAVSKIEIVVSRLKLPGTNWNCLEQIEIAVSKIEIAVTLLGHRIFQFLYYNVFNIDKWRNAFAY